MRKRHSPLGASQLTERELWATLGGELIEHPRLIRHLPMERDWPRDYTGSGIYRLIIEPNTGLVTKVTVEKSIKLKSLDDAFVKGLAQWRWRPGTGQKLLFLLVSPIRLLRPAERLRAFA